MIVLVNGEDDQTVWVLIANSLDEKFHGLHGIRNTLPVNRFEVELKLYASTVANVFGEIDVDILGSVAWLMKEGEVQL